jgi:nucleotide-binding universal stress UspA family protein
LIVLHVDDDGRNGGAAASQAALEIYARQVSQDVTGSQCSVVSGDAAELILSESRVRNAGLLVLGSRGRSRVGRLALGSVVSRVLGAARTPVLVVRAACDPFTNGVVVVGMDFSAASEAALQAGATLAGAAGATVDALHVLPFGDHASAGHAVLQREALDRLDACRRRLVPAAVASRSSAEMVRMSDPAATIAAHATQVGARLIVVGGHGHSGLVEGLLGSVAERVIRSAPVPVLVVRPPRAVPES